MPELTIRLAEPAEYAAAGALTRDAYVRDGFEDPDSTYAAILADGADRAANAALYVAVDDAGTLLGTVTYCRPGGSYSEIATSREAEFRMLAVATDARRRGVAEALVRRMLAQATADGMDALLLLSSAAMATAHRLYVRLGFVRTPDRDWYLPQAHLHAYRAPLHASADPKAPAMD